MRNTLYLVGIAAVLVVALTCAHALAGPTVP
jgi:hypothetical protein